MIIAILLAVIVYGAVHSLLASFWLKRWAEARFGGNARRLYRLLFTIISVVTLVPILFLPLWFPDRVLYRIPYPWVALTLLLQGLSGLGLLAGVWQTGALAFIGLRQWFTPPGSLTQEEGQLVTVGLYRWIRHPLYTFGLLFIWLTPIMTQGLLILYLGLSGYIVVGAILEEKKLVQRFGQAYQDYRLHTPMFIPGLLRKRQPQ